MRTGRTRRNGRLSTPLRASTLVVLFLLGTLLLGTVPAWAAVTAPGSASVTAGSAAGVNVSTDGATVSALGSHTGISVGRSGSAPNFRFTFTAGTQVSEGSYSYTFADDVGGSSGFTLNVSAAPPTTTTQPPTTTTTSASTTTTRATTTTTEAPEETTTTSSSTTTVPPTTTTAAPTTTTSTTSTLPPTTTSSTLVPAAVAALGDGDEGQELPIAWIGGGAALLAIIALGAFLYSRRRPAYGTASPGFLLAMQHRSQKRRATALSRPSRSAGVASWWRNFAPVVAVRESRSARSDAKDLNRKIAERRRLRGE